MATNSLIIRFKNPLSYKEIPLFRGAVINAVGDECSSLFHNHTETGFRYNYPMIQYKRIGGCAALVCVGDGCEEIGQFFSSNHFQLQIGSDRNELFEIDKVLPRRTLIQVWDTAFEYHLRNWLPLNAENYKAYQQLSGVAERAQMLEGILIGNILSACKGLGVHVEQKIECKITQIDEPWKIFYKGIPWMCFGGSFISNISLPDYIGLGKGASMGHGVVVRVYKKRITENTNDNGE